MQASSAADVTSHSRTPESLARSRAKPGKSWLGVKCVGIGGSTLNTVALPNQKFEPLLETTDSWISKRTGIRSRRILQPSSGYGLRSMAIDAAQSALKSAGLSDGSSLDMVIVATSSPDDMFGDAAAVAHALQAPQAAAFDLTAACAGFVYALVTGAQFVHSGSCKRVLVIGADALSRHVDWTDRGSCILFGDGAGAMVLEAPEAGASGSSSGVLGFALHSDGSGQKHLKLPYRTQFVPLATACTGGNAEQDASKTLETESVQVDVGAYDKLQMEGAEVFKFAVNTVPSVLKEALTNAGLTLDDVDWFVLHQANLRIIEQVAKELGVNLSKFVTRLSEVGNTSAASIPLAMAAQTVTSTSTTAQASDPFKIKEGDVVAICGFGAGLSWGAAIVRWGH